MHANIIPSANEECIACGICAENCPKDAIIIEKRAVVNHDRCIGCGECIAICPENAMHTESNQTNEALIEKVDEYAYGVLKDRKSTFFNFLMDMTPHCDCMALTDGFFAGDIGIAASDDPVALDKASIDLVGEKNFAFTSVDYARFVTYGETIGLGSGKYTLVEC